ncbi:unnamed protein product [Rotaria sordida]|uniref:SCP domain-containing protein n=2 Tax=Rotaria sordida TaxID=392033 RepID=A0A818NNE1_9BILA|nr:unnamed protein product [Rotaria sordida]CAF3607603.1 unnamed protein product [Rotaria sordida]
MLASIVEPTILKCQDKLSGYTYGGNYGQPEMVDTFDGWVDLRAQECEKKSGYPKGTNNVKKLDIKTLEACKTACDQNLICWGWGFEIASSICNHYPAVEGFASSDGYFGGSCYVSNPPYPDGLSLRTFRQQALDKHNEYRKIHCSEELKLNNDLNDISQDYAEQLAEIDQVPPNHSGIRMENLYYQRGNYKLPGSDPVLYWYQEIEFYNWTNPDFSMAHHFAKLIWNGARELGVGVAYSKANITMYVVATYSPGGYLEESYDQNVRKKC